MEIKKCENCEEEHNGEYGSGRFCSCKCARSFSSLLKRELISEKVKLINLNKRIKKKCEYYDCSNILIQSKNNKKKFCCRSCVSKNTNSLLENKLKSSQNAIKNGLGGNKNKYSYGYYESKYAGRVFLESSYEYKVAVELDNNNINWIRPKPLNWFDIKTNKFKKYYPDFYLIDYNVYLDPKNDYLITIDEFKISEVIKQNNVIVLILNKNNLKWKNIEILIK